MTVRLLLKVLICFLATAAWGQDILLPPGNGRLALGLQLPPLPTGPLLSGVDPGKCLLQEGLSYDPRWQLVATSSLRGLWRATSSTADSVQFDASGALKVEFSRSSRTLSAGVTVALNVLRPGEQSFSELCRVRIPRLGQRDFWWLATRLPDHMVTVRVDVLDEGNGGPTGDPPYTVGLSAYSSERPSSSAMVPEQLRPGASNECESVSRPKRKEATLESARKVSFDGKHRHWRYLDYVEAGRNLYLRLDFASANPASVAIEVVAFAKNGGREGFDFVCRLMVRNPRKTSMLLLASRPPSDTHLFNSIWRIEARPVRMSGDELAHTAATIEVYRDEDPERTYATAGSGELALGSLSFICVPPPSRFPSRSPGSGFVNSQVVDVEVGAESRALSQEGRRTLEEYIVQAAGLWRESCQQCQIDSLLVVRINGKVYWRAGAIQISPAEGTKLADLVGVFYARSTMSSYVDIESSATVRKQVCSVPHAASTARLQSLQGALGCPGAGHAQPPLRVKLALQRAATACGDDPDIVACESKNELIELNLRDYSFRAFGFGRTVIPGGPRSIDLFHVVLHEMGHWIGVDHQEEAGSVMSAQFSTSRCIDAATAAQIGSGASRESGRHGPRGFRYEGGAAGR